MACTISDDWSYLGFKTVILENELIRATVLPDLGAKIHELIYKPSDHDFMYHHPRVECRVPVFDVNVDDWWTGGMDEAIPTGHPCIIREKIIHFLGKHGRSAGIIKSKKYPVVRFVCIYEGHWSYPP